MTNWNFTDQGHVAVEGGKIWYGICGDMASSNSPLLVIHGGPGMSHDYLYPLSDLADDRAIIFYDQLDAGQSDRSNDPKAWRVDRFLDEIDGLRVALPLDRLCLFGNSWGGTLAAAYAARKPHGLQRLVLSSPLIQTETWLRDNAAYRTGLPAEIVAIMDSCEADGCTSDPAYLDAVNQFYRRHLCRTDPWPDYVNRTFEVMNEACYTAMWGANEFTCSGVLKDYDGSSGLSNIDAPTLVTCGAFDEATPESTRRFARMIPNAQFEVFGDASHMAFVEVRSHYIARIRQFLSGQR